MMGVSELRQMFRTLRASLGTAACILAAIVAITLSGGFISPAHALNPIMHNSSTTSSTKWPGGWGNSAGSKYGQFVCNTCHTAGLTPGPNAKGIKTAIATPNGSTWGATGQTSLPVTFGSYTAYGKDTNHTTSIRVCEVCHSATNHHRYDNSTNGANHNGSVDCMTCHSHSNGFRSPVCDSCHGNPPIAASNTSVIAPGNTGVVFPTTNGTTGLSPGAHQVHNSRGYVCAVCHNGNSSTMPSYAIEMGFKGFNGRVTTGTFTGYTTLNGETFVSSSAGTSVIRRTAAVNPTCSNL